MEEKIILRKRIRNLKFFICMLCVAALWLIYFLLSSEWKEFLSQTMSVIISALLGGIGYSLLNDHVFHNDNNVIAYDNLKKIFLDKDVMYKFIDEIRNENITIKDEVNKYIEKNGRENRSISKFGLISIDLHWNVNSIIEQLKTKKTTRCVLLNMIGEDLFKNKHNEILQCIKNNNLNIVLYLLSPLEWCAHCFSFKMEEDQHYVATKIKKMINKYIIEKIYNKIDQHKKQNLTLYLYKYLPPYSFCLYGTAEEWYELWIMPYFHRKGAFSTPVLKFKVPNEENRLYKDVIEFMNNSANLYEEYDLEHQLEFQNEKFRI